MYIADAAGGAGGLHAVASSTSSNKTARTNPGGSVTDAAQTYKNDEKVRRLGRRLNADAAVLVESAVWGGDGIVK